MSFLTDKLQKVVNLGLHGYPLDERHLFSAKAGQLLPIFNKPMLPGDVFDIDIVQTSQTAPFNKAAFFRCKKYFHFWFVPYSFMWSQWDSYISQRVNPRSANSKGSRFVPNIPLLNIFRMVNVAYEESVNPPVQDIRKDDIGNRPYQGFLRMLDLMGFGNWTIEEIQSCLTAYSQGDEQIVSLLDKCVNLWVPAAYQYIYNYVYRNKYFDDAIDAHFFNFDDIVCSTVEDSKVNNAANLVNYGPYGSEWRWWNLFMMRYRQWNHDMFTGVLPSSQYGEVSTVSSLNTVVNMPDFSGDSTQRVGVSALQSGGSQLIVRNSQGQGLSGGSTFNIPNLFNVLQLRKAEAMQKWKETTMRNGRDARSQAIGHYGVVPSHSLDYQPVYVGGFDDRIVCDPVTATSNTQGVDESGEQNIGSVLGQLAGRGVSVNDNGHIKFKASEFGVLMCIFSIVPDADYDAAMLDKQHTLLEPFDYWTPELENLGFEPVTQSELSIKPLLDGYGQGHIVSVTGYNPNNVLGYLPRYHMYKTTVDKLHGEFCSGRSLEAMAVPRRDLIRTLYRIVGDPFRPDSATYVGMNKSSFYINPNILNNVFNIEADETQLTDQFYNLVMFKNRAARPLSVLGLPY